MKIIILFFKGCEYMFSRTVKPHVDKINSTVNTVNNLCDTCIKMIDSLAYSQMQAVKDGYTRKETVMPTLAKIADMKLQLQNQKIIANSVLVQVDNLGMVNLTDPEIIFSIQNMDKALEGCINAVINIQNSIKEIVK